MRTYSLYAVVERPDGSIMRQRVSKVDNHLDEDEIRKKLKSYREMLGRSYLIVDWYIDV